MTRALLKHWLVSFAVHASAGFWTFAATLYGAALLGPDGNGRLTYILTAMWLIVSLLGIGQIPMLAIAWQPGATDDKLTADHQTYGLLRACLASLLIIPATAQVQSGAMCSALAAGATGLWVFHQQQLGILLARGLLRPFYALVALSPGLLLGVILTAQALQVPFTLATGLLAHFIWQAASLLLGQIILQFFFPTVRWLRHWGRCQTRAFLQQGWMGLTAGFAFFVSQLVPRLDIGVLSLEQPAAALGIYALAACVAERVMLLGQSLCAVRHADLVKGAQSADRHRQTLRLLGIVGLCSGTLVASLYVARHSFADSALATWLFGAYRPMVGQLLWRLGIGYSLVGATAIVHQHLIYMGYQRLLLQWQLLLLLPALLILHWGCQRHGILGVAVSTSLVHLLFFGLHAGLWLLRGPLKSKLPLPGAR